MVALVLDGLVGFPAGLSPTSFVSQFFSVGVPGWLVSHFLSFASQFFSFPKQFTVRGSQCFKEWSPWCWMVWSGSQPACLPLPLSPSSFQSGFPAGLSPTSFHLPPNSFHSPNSLLLGVLNALKNGRLGAGWSGRVPGRLVSHFLLFVSHFFSFVSQARCLWSGSRLACLPLPFICLPLLFICLPVLFICLPGWVLVVGFPAGLSPTSFHLGLPLPFICLPLLFICLPVLFICLPGWVSPLQWTKPTRQERCLMAYFAVLAFCLPSDFHNIGPRACENCKQLVEVNLMCTEVTALHKSTFAQCVAMTDIWLPPRLTQIGKEVFLNCIALREVVVPTELQRYRSSGFLWV